MLGMSSSFGAGDGKELRMHTMIGRVGVVVGVLTAAASGQWTVTNLHVPGASNSRADSVSGNQQSGYVWNSGNDERASLWTGSAGSWVNLNPLGSTRSRAFSANDGRQYGVAVIDGITRAGLWSGSAASWVDLSPADAIDSAIYAAEGGQQVGAATIGGLTRAGMWSGTSESWVDLSLPGGPSYSFAYGVDDGQQVGFGYVPGGQKHAILWSGSAASWVDLNPAGSNGSEANGVDGGRQVGFVTMGGKSLASLWSGTASSWVNLNPIGSTASIAYGISANEQVGYVDVPGGGVSRASLWSGSAASWVDLSAFLPIGYSSSVAKSIWTHGGVTYVAGYAENRATLRDEAFLWTRAVPEPASAVMLLLGGLAMVITRARTRK